MTEHAVSIIAIGDPDLNADPTKPRYRALCACGFKGVRTYDRLVSEAQAEQHLAYVSEVAELTREQRR